MKGLFWKKKHVYILIYFPQSFVQSREYQSNMLNCMLACTEKCNIYWNSLRSVPIKHCLLHGSLQKRWEIIQ